MLAADRSYGNEVQSRHLVLGLIVRVRVASPHHLSLQVKVLKCRD